MSKRFSILLVLIVVLTSSVLFAQPQPPGRAIPPPNDLPIDGGLGVLLALGIGYAVKKLRKEN